MTTTVMSRVESAAHIQELGKKGVKHTSDYFLFMTKLINRNPDLRKFIRIADEIEGTGWSIGVGYYYGLTYPGITKVLRILKINAVVADTAEKLAEFFASVKDGEAKCCVSDLGILEDKSISYHAVSVLAERKMSKIRVAVLNSDAGYKEWGDIRDAAYQGWGYAVDIRKKIPILSDLELYKSSVIRKGGEATCSAFAIGDCAVFQTNPNLIQEIVDLNGNSDELKKLPGSLMESKAVKKALEYQALIITDAEEAKEVESMCSFS